jgi:hypothetical protein
MFITRETAWLAGEPRPCGHRNPEIRADFRAQPIESLVGHPDHRERFAVQRDGLPTIDESALKRRVQNAWLRTMTGDPDGLSTSAGNGAPRRSRMVEIAKKPDVTGSPYT